MDIFCEECQKKVGQIADEKIPDGKKLTVTCPKCGRKINFTKAVDLSEDLDVLANEPGDLTEMPGELHSNYTSFSSASAQDSSDYDFNVMTIVREAWAKTTGMKGPVWGAIGLAVLAVIMVFAAVVFVSAIYGGGSVVAALGGAAQLTFSVASYPFMAGLMLIGIRHSVGLPVDFKTAFSCFGYILPIVIASFMVSILSGLGFLLFILPGIYLSLAYLLVIPLIIDKEMGPWQAMEASRKAIHGRWFKVFGLYLLMSAICLLSVIPMGLGLIWTVPMFIMVGGILYREVFGVTQRI
jgi:hypothetical protein